MIKKVYLITPNIPEAEVLTKTKIKTLEDMDSTCQYFIKLGVKNVLLKGGHRKSEYMEDSLLNRKEIKIF